jgi:predicted ester cyclase
MSLTENKALVRRYYEEMWNRWNDALADELIDGAITFRGSLGVAVQGRGAFKDYIRTVRAAFPDFHNHIEDLIAESDRVVARLTYTGTHSGELFGIRATGRQIAYAGVAIFHIALGRVVEGWVLGDVHGLRRQLGDGGA